MEREPVNSNEHETEKRENSPEQECNDAELGRVYGGSQQTNTMYRFLCNKCGLMCFSREAPVTVCRFCGSEDGSQAHVTL